MVARLADSVQVAARFHRSVNVELDFERADSLDGYVVSPLARDVTLRITGALVDPHGARAWTLIGPYGSGKSSLVAFLCSLVCEGPAHISGYRRLQRSWSEDSKKLEKRLLGDDGFGPLVPVLVTGERTSLVRSILGGLRKASQAYWSGRGVNPDVVTRIAERSTAADAGEAVEHDEVVDLTLEFARKVRSSSRPGNGLFIVLDEMGKLLEWAALNPHNTDLYLLQRLAEAAARSKVPIGLLTVLHQDISAYAANLTRTMRDEWTKIGGRFETIVYLEPVEHIVRLLDGAISANDEAMSTRAADECRLVADALAQGDLFRRTLPLLGTFPIHPLTALCVGPLFRSTIGQNERSVFAFLNSHEPLGFQDWLSRSDGSEPYRLSDLFNYAIHNTRALVEGTRSWSSAEFALARIGGSADRLDANLVRTISLLTMVRASADVRADLPTLALATGQPEAEVKKSLGRLKKASVALYIKHRSAWELWDGSDVDIDDVIAQQRTELLARGGLAEQIGKAVKPTPITASRHYIQTGTFRVLRVAYASTLEAAQRQKPERGDGILVVLVPDQLDDVAEFRAILATIPAEPAVQPPRAMTLPVNVEQFHEQGLEFLAVSRALKLTPKLESDPIARRVLQERQLAARDALQAAHEIACAGFEERPAEWRFEGSWRVVHVRASHLASSIFDEAFEQAPKIHNELINRSQISSAAAGGRKILMQRMLTHADRPRLGIEGYPPELSMYRSILERMGLHHQSDRGWGLTHPRLLGGKSPLAAVWEHIGHLLEADGAQMGSRRTFQDLTTALAQPPYGVRSGVAPILIWAWYLVHQDDVFLYEDNTFVPEPEEALVERLLRQPQDVELQSAAFSGRLAEVALAIRRRAFPRLDLDKGRVPLRVVRQLILFVKRLSHYAQRTRNVSVAAIRVRTELLAAKDTVKLLVDSLPRALEVDVDRENGVEEFARRLAHALRELREADQGLLGIVERTLRTMFESGQDDPQFFHDIAQRAAALRETAGAEPRVQQFIEQTAALEPDSVESREIWLRSVAANICTMQPERWSDSDVHGFKRLAEERVREFVATERLAFQMKYLNGAASGRPIVRVDYIDNSGNKNRHFGQFGVREGDDADMEALIEQAQAEIQRLRNQAKIRSVSDRGVAYALLTAMMKTLEKTTVGEDR